MSTNGNEPSGIHAKRIEAENVVSGVQIQGGDAQTASPLIQLAQSIRQGTISAEEIKVRNLVSGLQYIADPAQASVEDLRRELNALRTQLEQAVASQEFSDPADTEDAQESPATTETELTKPDPKGNRLIRELLEDSSTHGHYGLGTVYNTTAPLTAREVREGGLGGRMAIHITK